MKHSPEPWKAQAINELSTHTSVSAQGWGSFALFVTRMADEDHTSEKGIANLNRAIACVNAMAGIEDPAEFVKLAEAHRQDVIEWERLMMELVGEDGFVSVKHAIVRLKQDAASKATQTSLTETDRDNLCDILWWLKGYKKGAHDKFKRSLSDVPYHVHSTWIVVTQV